MLGHYERLDKVYDQRWRRYNRRTLNQAIDVLELSGGERVLDVGCGTGMFAELVLERFQRLELVGIDAAPALVRVARQKFRHDSRVSFHIARAEALPFASETFDVVVSCSMLHHVRAAITFLEECVRALRPGGTLVVVDWCRDSWYGRLFHLWLRLADRSYVRMYRVTELAALMGSRGLEVKTSGRFIAPPLWGMLWLVAKKGVDSSCHA